jgi:protein-disulfide isomerase
VIYADYQCSDCRQAEDQLNMALPGRCELAVTYKHFPLSHACNRRVQSTADHRHACRAALAAEAAGLLGGPPGFLRLHAWLFQCGANFTEAELAAALPSLGFADTDTFFRTMYGAQAAQHLREDIEEGISLGLAGTPAVFVEGVRLEGVTAERALSRLLESLDSAGKLPPPPPHSPKEHGRQMSYRP